MKQSKCAEFVSALSTFSPLPSVANPWRDWVEGFDASEQSPDIRCKNLKNYLEHRVASARLVFIGEAPGYQGARWSGIAMTSERILLDGKASVPSDLVFPGAKARSSSSALFPDGANEPTATIAWSLLHGLGLPANEYVFWNAFPFHPHKPNELLTNRAPKPPELTAAGALLPGFLELFPHARVVAVGRVAQASLAKLGISAPSVRHPAMGGATQFRQQVQALLQEESVDA